MTKDSVHKSEYWEGYYASLANVAGQIPSQFAVFVAQELEKGESVIDIGCGSGRDSFFFARSGHRTVGVDGSHEAISKCREAVDHLALEGLSFECMSIESGALSNALSALLADCDGRVTIYARFFLHAITEEEEERLFDAIQSMARIGDQVAFEFRTVRDAALSKVTAAHYRRYIEPATTVAAMAGRGFNAVYMVEGFGFAKYKADDAYVARLIFRKDA